MDAYQYLVAEKNVTLEPDEHRIAIRFKDDLRRSGRLDVTRGVGLKTFEDRVELPNEKFTLFDLPLPSRDAKPMTCTDVSQALCAHAKVERVAPVFRHGRTRLVATDRILVGMRTGADVRKKAEDLAKTIGGTIAVIVAGEAGQITYFVIQLATTSDPLRVAQEVSKLPGVEFAEPDFVHMGPKLTRLFAPAPETLIDRASRNYAMHVTRAVDAWSIVRGDPSVKIAILDDGVDTTHPDLAGVVENSFDAIDGDSFQEPNPWDGHGTACAGLAVAVGSGAGMSGVGRGCSLLAVRVLEALQRGDLATGTTAQFVAGIEWAWRQGADILSNSWDAAPSNALAAAIKNALTLGRGGKGSIVVFAAGNASGKVGFPADLSGVVCVAASNEFDEPKTMTSQDGESWWGSNFGDEVTVAAPGVHNFTTDIAGRGGYIAVGPEPNYTPNFNGTSSAAPIVAGALGLILSANPKLTGEQARRVLVDTADKVGNVQYIRDRNPQMGAGRINVFAAVQQARRT